ncbi:hypothetical protein D3C76_1446960 [compost metagenome]
MQQVDTAVGTFDEQLHLRVLEHVAGQHRPDPGVEQGGRAADADQAARFAAVALDDFRRALGLHAHGQATVVVGLADLGQRAVPAGAVQQPHAQAVFKVGDAPAEF